MAQAPKADDKHAHAHDAASQHIDPKAPPLGPVSTAEEARRTYERSREENAKLYDDLDDVEGPITTQTDQLLRSRKMEAMGPTAFMEEENRRIAERSGEPPVEPRQVHGVAPVERQR